MKWSTSVFLVLCFSIAGCTTGYDGGPPVDRTVATLGCGAAGAGIGAGVAGKGNRGAGAVIGGLLGAGICNAILRTDFNDMEEGSTDCRTRDGIRICFHNDPQAEDSPVLADCNPLTPISLNDDLTPSWECMRAADEVHYYPRA